MPVFIYPLIRRVYAIKIRKHQQQQRFAAAHRNRPRFSYFYELWYTLHQYGSCRCCCRFALHKLAHSHSLHLMFMLCVRIVPFKMCIQFPPFRQQHHLTHLLCSLWSRIHKRMNTLKYDSIITFMLINCFFMQLTHSLICCYYCYYHLAYFFSFFPILQFSFFYLLFDVMIMMMLIISRAQFKQSMADGRCFFFEKIH